MNTKAAGKYFVLLANVLAQNPQIQFQTDPVLVQTGTDIVLTVVTLPSDYVMTWKYQGGITLGVWAAGTSTVFDVPQFRGRVSITATQLRVSSSQLRDAGNYTAEVTTGLATNSRSVQVRVFDGVAGVTLSVPSVAVEGRNISLTCKWTAGTDVTVQWGKGGAAITADSSITISRGLLVISPARRGDAGDYTCTVRNPVSAGTAQQSLTVYYGPDTPVLTKDTPKDCVGGGDVLVGATVRFTCTSDSLPPALFSWQRNGQPVTSNPAGSGVLSFQTFSATESGRFICTARNDVTEGTSEQGTDLAIVETCLNGGEVAGIVIGCVLLIIIIALVIFCLFTIVRRRKERQRQRETVVVQRTNTNPRPVPPDPQPNRARDLGNGSHRSPSHTQTRHPDHLYTAPLRNPGNSQTLPLNGAHNSDTRQHNGHTHTNGLVHNAIHNTDSYPHNGVDNPAFMHTDAPNTNTLANMQQQNPNILIQTGTAQGAAQPAAVHVSLNTLPRTGQQNNNAQMPTIHVNLNPYPTNGQQTQQDSSLPFTNTNVSQTQQNLVQTGQSNPRMQTRLSYPSGTLLNDHIDPGHRVRPELIPTRYTHYNGDIITQRNANTQTYQQDPEPHSRSDRNSHRHDAAANSSQHQMPWDRLRGTPAYPNGTLQRGHVSHDYNSYTTDYTYSPPAHQARMPERPQPRPQSQTTSRTRPVSGQVAPLVDRRPRSRSSPYTLRVPQLEPANRTRRSPRTQRERAQQDIRGLHGSQTAPRQEATNSSYPQALPLMSQQASVGHVAVLQGPATQQGPSTPRGADTRALADPNHLPQAHMAQHHRVAPVQTTPQGLGTQTQAVIRDANQPRQGGAAPGAHPSTQPNPGGLTQAALEVHTSRAQTFQNRKQQTQAALLHPGQHTQAPAAGAQRPPAPPPVIPLAQFQALPKQRTQHKSPTRGPQPPRPPVNIPVAQRHLHARQRPNHHHPPGNGHVHATAHRHAHAHARGHGNPAHFAHPWQQQAHRGRPR